MTKKYMRGTLTALSAVAGLALAGCADENPYPTYNNGVAYYQASPSGTTYYVPSSGTTYYSPSTGTTTTYYTPGVTYYAPPPPAPSCFNCDYHDGQWHH